MRVVMVNWSDRADCPGGRSLQVADLADQLRRLGHLVATLDARSLSSYAWSRLANADVVHGHGGFSALLGGMIGLRRALRPGPRLVSTLHGWHHRHQLDSIEHLIERTGLYLSDRVTVPSSAMLAQLPGKLR